MRLHRKGFAKWVASHPPDEVIGMSCTTDSCPLTWYLRDKKGMRRPYANGKYYWDDAGNMRVTPPWASRFIDLVDRTHVLRFSDGAAIFTKGGITASRALEVLAVVEKELEIV
jgi:hypothetical protein